MALQPNIALAGNKMSSLLNNGFQNEAVDSVHVAQAGVE
jgi:hypothetical protein